MHAGNDIRGHVTVLRWYWHVAEARNRTAGESEYFGVALLNLTQRRDELNFEQVETEGVRKKLPADARRYQHSVQLEVVRDSHRVRIRSKLDENVSITPIAKWTLDHDIQFAVVDLAVGV